MAEYYKIKVADLAVQTPLPFGGASRQMAMALAKELTNHSLPEIGDAFGGRDHTTALHACRKIGSCVKKATTLRRFFHLIRTLSS